MEPTATPTATPSPTRPPTLPLTPTPTPTPAPTLNPGAFDGNYQLVTKREWASVVRSPDDHQFETITAFGCISQFDSDTGADTFRAQASYRKQNYWYLYGDNSLFTALDETLVADFYEDDVFKAEVTIFGSFSYDTTLGGQLTVPWFEIDSIIRLKGSC